MKVIVLLMFHDVIGTGRVPDVGKWAIRHDFPLYRINSIIEVWLKLPVPVFSTQAESEIRDLGAILNQVVDVSEVCRWQLLDCSSRLLLFELWRFGPGFFVSTCQYDFIVGWHMVAAKLIEVPVEQIVESVSQKQTPRLFLATSTPASIMVSPECLIA